MLNAPLYFPELQQMANIVDVYIVINVLSIGQ